MAELPTSAIMNPMLLDFPSEFTSERLLIRAPRPGDGAAVYAEVMASLTNFQRWLPFTRSPQSPEGSEEGVRKAAADFLTRVDLRLLVFLKDGQTLVGSSGLHNIDWSVPKFEIGYWLSDRYTGRGYMTEAVERITQFAFEDLRSRRVEICCDSHNLKSRGIPDRLGFLLEAHLKNHDRNADGELRDTLIFAKTK